MLPIVTITCQARVDGCAISSINIQRIRQTHTCCGLAHGTLSEVLHLAGGQYILSYCVAMLLI